MSIGKNAIKRVENNGYSAVVTSAPDMEDSVIAEAPEPAAEKKPAAKRTKAPVSHQNGFERYEIGSELPVWLL